MDKLFVLLLCVAFVATLPSKNFAEEEKAVEEGKITVNIPNLGEVTGKVTSSYFSKRNIFQFLGINYAASPSGANRFLPPREFPAWTTTYDATKMRQRCPQLDDPYYPPLNPDEIVEGKDDEDCLILNIFTPKVPKTSDDPLMPVMVYIHGGSFYEGSAYFFLPDFLLEKDILLVTIQYRIGVLGFATLQENKVPGNAGMLDIIASLEWIQRYIEPFGGDPKRVTVVGQSAGAAAASALLTSPLIIDRKPPIFSQMAIHSGSSMSIWAINYNALAMTERFISMLQCESDGYTCLMNADVRTLLSTQDKFMKIAAPGASELLCTLVLQPPGPGKVLLEDPGISFEKGSFYEVPLLIGNVRDEASGFVTGYYDSAGKLPKSYFERNMTRDVLMLMGVSDKSNAVIDMFHNKYFINANDFKEASPGLIDLFSSHLFKGPTIQVARRMSTHKPTFLYSFNFKGTVSKLADSEPNWDEKYPFPIGVAHSDELGYLFPHKGHNYTKRELKMVHTMVNLWTNFVINGNPGPTPEVKSWKAMANEFGPYLKIDDIPREESNVFSEYEINMKEGFKRSGASRARLATIIIFFSIWISL